MKTCSKCGEQKALDQFSTDNRKPDRLTLYCKECLNHMSREYRAKKGEELLRRRREIYKSWYRTVAGYRATMWHSMNARCGTGLYKDIVVKMTKEEWEDFSTPLLEAFIRDHPRESPSVDRIDPEGHYERDNIRIIPFQDNVARSGWNLHYYDVNRESSREKKLDTMYRILKGNCEALNIDIHEAMEFLNETISKMDGGAGNAGGV